jgi:hypothetical protein
MTNLANLTLAEKKDIGRAYKLTRDAFNKEDVVKRLLWLVKIEKRNFIDNIDPSDLELPVYVRPKMANCRIIAQSEVFIVYGAHSLVSGIAHKDLRIQRVIVPASKGDLRTQLERLGIHASSLFPEIDKAADFIVKRYAHRQALC